VFWGWVVFVLVVFGEFIDKRNRQKSRPARESIRETILDPWIEACYPPGFGGEHGEHPNPRYCQVLAKFDRGEKLTPAQVDELVTEIAFDLEFRARRLYAGYAFKGILQGAGTIVWTEDAADSAVNVLANVKPGDQAQKRLDRAIAWWVQARLDGARVFEWDEDGYDEVTPAFDRVARFATDAAPEIDSDAHGVTVRRDVIIVPAFTPPGRWKPALRIAGATVVFVAYAWWLQTDFSPSHTPGTDRSRTCGEQLVKVEEAAKMVLKREPDRAADIQQVLAQARTGERKQALENWKLGGHQAPSATLLEVELFLLTVCKPVR